MLQETLVYRVIDALANVISKRNEFEGIQALALAKPAYVVEEGLFVADIVIELQVIMDLQLVGVADLVNLFVGKQAEPLRISLLCQLLFIFAVSLYIF